MQNGHDAEPAADTGPHLSAAELALDQLMTAADDWSSWAVLARSVLLQVEESLSRSVEDDENRELLNALMHMLEFQHDRVLGALEVARRARGETAAEAVE